MSAEETGRGCDTHPLCEIAPDLLPILIGSFARSNPSGGPSPRSIRGRIRPRHRREVFRGLVSPWDLEEVLLPPSLYCLRSLDFGPTAAQTAGDSRPVF